MGVALELLPVLCIFENSTKCNEISFDPHSFLDKLKDKKVSFDNLF